MLCSFQGTILLLRFLVFFILKNACNIFLKVEPSKLNSSFFLPRKEVIQPHLPIRLPCYDFTPVIGFALGDLFLTDFGHPQLPWCDGRCVQDPGTHSPRHSDSRLLATPTSCRRVSAYNPNLDHLFEVCLTSQFRFSL